MAGLTLSGPQRRAGAVTSISILALVASPVLSTASGAGNWGAHVEPSVKGGTERSIGSLDAFLPVWQDDDRLVFADLRGVVDDRDGREFNLGLGGRLMTGSGWNVGAYGFFDRRRSEKRNYFEQITVGAEALSVNWDLRTNYYEPIGDTTKPAPSQAELDLSGNQLQLRAGQERALGGFDAGIGYRLPFTEPSNRFQTRVYGTAFRFNEDDVESVNGARGRIELRWHEPLDTSKGSRLTAFAEVQDDDVRGQQSFAGLRFRIPFGERASRSELGPQGARMTERVQRDVDIVSQAGAFRDPEPVRAVANGTRISETVTAKDLEAAIDEAGTNGLVIAGDGKARYDGGVTLQENQMLLGGSATIAVEGVESGQRARFTAPGERPTIAGGGSEDFVIETADGAWISTVDIEAGQDTDHGIQSSGDVAGLRIENARVSATADAGVVFEGTARDVQITGSTVQNTDDAGLVFEDKVEDLTVARSEFANAGGQGIVFENIVDKARISDTGFNNNVEEALEFSDNATKVRITGNDMRNTGDEGVIFLEDVTETVIRDNTIVNSDDKGILIGNGSGDDVGENLVIAGNTIRNSRGGDGAGIDVDGAATDVELTGNLIENVQTYGIVLREAAERVAITGNTIRNTEDDGIKFEADATDIAIRDNRVAFIDNEGVQIEGATEGGVIAGNTIQGSLSGDGVELDATTNVTLRDNVIEGVDDRGLEFTDDAEGVTLSGNTVRNTAREGIQFDGDVKDSVIRNNVVANYDNEGIEVLGASTNVAITDNVVRNSSGDDGIYLDDVTDSEILRNTVKSVAEVGINVTGDAEGTDVRGNTVRGTGEEGVQFQGAATNVSIADNLIEDVDEQGLQIDGAADTVRITDNTIRNSRADEGIEFVGTATDTEVRRNLVENVDKVGIEFASDADGVTVANNTVRQTGLDGIDFSGPTIIDGRVTGNRIADVGDGNAWLDINSDSNSNTEVSGNTFAGFGGSTVVEVDDGDFTGGSNSNETAITSDGDVCDESGGSPAGPGFAVVTDGDTVTCGAP